MLTGRLELRSWPAIVVAYFVGPFAGLSVWWLMDTFPNFGGPNLDPNSVSLSWVLTVGIGGIICLFIELFIITPLLIGFAQYRWSWLNGWSAALIGFLLGAVPTFASDAPNPSLSPDQITGPGNMCPNGRCSVEGWLQAGLGPPWPQHHSHAVWEAAGHWTAAGWAFVAMDVAKFGAVGLVAAIIFRLIAVRSTPGVDPALGGRPSSVLVQKFGGS